MKEGIQQPRSPVPAIAISLLVGAVLAIAAVLVLAATASEALLTGAFVLGLGLGWALMAYLTLRFSSQLQRWMLVPAAAFIAVSLVLVVLQPGPALMDAWSWVWPPALAALAIWMFIRVRRDLRGRGRLLLAPVIGLTLLAAIGGAASMFASTAGRQSESGPGKLVDVGGRRLYLECTGSGAPAVLLQSGLGDSSEAWARIAPTVASTTTVCAYDRAGHGRSDEAGPQDGVAIATDLHELLAKAGVPGPYVLVGHSSGGPYQRVFAGQYPDEVVGMVLVDAQPPDAFTALPDFPGFYQSFLPLYGMAPSLARLDLLGLLVGTSPEQSTPEAARTARDEFRSLPAALAQAQQSGDLGDRPLVIVTALKDSQPGWREAHDAMLTLSTNAVQRRVEAGTHYSVMTGDDSGITAQAILDVVSAVRTGSPVR